MLLVIESTDLLFAVDSVPAIFGVIRPTEPNSMFLVFTSNIFAIIGSESSVFLARRRDGYVPVFELWA